MNLLEGAAGAVRFASLFSDEKLVAAMLRYEVGLARCQAELGMIAPQAAHAIAHAAASFRIDTDALARDGALAGSLAIPFVKGLRRHVASIDSNAADYVHFGCTSQDVLDSAVALCSREGTTTLLHCLGIIATSCRTWALTQRDTPLLARTLLQAAGVTTFGHKAAQWHLAISDCRMKLEESARTALAVSLGGALGNLAGYGTGGGALRTALAHTLDLHDPGTTWHTLRHRWLALACDVALICGTLAKIAQDIALMAQSEVAEIEEPMAEGRGGSSALPHKRNPVLALQVLALTQPVPGWLANMLAAMPQAHERALGGWQSELAQWPAMMRNACAAAQALAELLDGLVLHPDQCLRNIDAMRGVIFAERAAALIAPHLGKVQAHDLLGGLCARALRESVPLLDLLRAEIDAHPHWPALQADALDACFSIQAAAQWSSWQVDEMLREAP